MNPPRAAAADGPEAAPPPAPGPRISYRPIWNVQQKAVAIYLCEPSPGAGAVETR